MASTRTLTGTLALVPALALALALVGCSEGRGPFIFASDDESGSQTEPDDGYPDSGEGPNHECETDADYDEVCIEG